MREFHPRRSDLNQACAYLHHVVKKQNDETTMVWAEEGVHGHLKRRRCIAQAKRHHGELIVTVMSSEGGLVNVILMHQNLVVTLLKVELSKPL